MALILVDEFLTNPDFPASSRNREFALSHILTETITSEFFHQRLVFKLPAVQSGDTRDSILKMIMADGQTGSTELIGWSWLYHHHVTIDANIKFEEFYETAHVEERTLRRYQQHIIGRLTDLLIDMEWKARIRQRKLRLLAELPGIAVAHLLGRDELNRYVTDILEKNPNAHFQITGARGIGKSSFVEAVLREQIDKDLIQQLVWIEAPLSADLVHRDLTERLLPQESQINLREYLLTNRTVIVLDDIEAFLGHIPALDQLLHDLYPATVFIINNVHVSLANTIPITIPEINREDVRMLVRELLEPNHQDETDEIEEALIWERIGGNPLAIRLFAGNPIHFDPNLNLNAVHFNLEMLFAETFSGLDHETQRAWTALSLLPPIEFEMDAIQRLWRRYFVPDTIAKLRRYHLLHHIKGNRYRLVSSAKHYIQGRYHLGDAQIYDMVQALLVDLDTQNYSDLQLGVVEYLLTSNWLGIEGAVRQNWIVGWWRAGLEKQHWATWRLLLEPQIENNFSYIDLCLAYAICLRHLGELALSTEVLRAVLAQTGRRGLFTKQAEILIELAIIFRYHGEYEQALMLLKQSQQIAHRLQLNDLISMAQIERIQIAVDTRSPELVENEWLSVVDTPRIRLLQSDLYFLNDDYENCRVLAQEMLDSAGDDFSLRSRIHVLLGRAYEKLNELTLAQEHLTWSVMILEQLNDAFALSRVQSNLGALFIRTRNYEEANDLLSNSEQIQLAINDRVGLAATRHNLQLLDIELSS